MKTAVLDDLQRQYNAVHGCYRSADGTCFYIASSTDKHDYGRQIGRCFFALVAEGGGDPTLRVTMRFLVAELARRGKAALIGDFESFCVEVGLDRLRKSLDLDSRTERRETILLTRDDADATFVRPQHGAALERSRSLKQEILAHLGGRHASGQSRVTYPALLDVLCADIPLVQAALRDLQSVGLLRDINDGGGMRLTPAAQLEVERTYATSRPTAPVAQTNAAAQYDFFICYASEDADVAEILHERLTRLGYSVWRDKGQLTLGDSLIGKISAGLSGSRFGIVILSAAFLQKTWPQAELRALETRALATGQKVVLPLRRDLTHDQLLQHFPLLADRLSESLNENIETAVTLISQAAEAQR